MSAVVCGHDACGSPLAQAGQGSPCFSRSPELPASSFRGVPASGAPAIMVAVLIPPDEGPEQRLLDAMDVLGACALRSRAAAAQITPQDALRARRCAYEAAARAPSPQQAAWFRNAGDGIVSRHPPSGPTDRLPTAAGA